MAGAAILALLMNSPQVKAEDEIVVFGGEFEDEKPARKKVEEPAPIKELPPPEEKPVEKPEPPQKPEVVEPPDLPPTQPQETQPEQKPLEQPAEELPQKIEEPPLQPQENLQPEPKPLEQSQAELPQEKPLEDDEDLGDTLIFNDLSKLPEQRPLEQPPQKIEPPPPVVTEPFQPTQISDEWKERVEQPVAVAPSSISSTPRQTQAKPQKELKMLKPRFIKLAVDDTYTYYLDKGAVEWRKMPYSSSEYMADVWIRMIEREPKTLDSDMAAYGAENFRAQIELAREQGYEYSPEDIKVLSNQAYILEHYYLRPKTRQVQFLCELEVFGRPQNAINERAYDYKNWENLVPGSVEATIYDAAIKILGKSKASERGHMTFFDMLDEYARIALN